MPTEDLPPIVKNNLYKNSKLKESKNTLGYKLNFKQKLDRPKTDGNVASKSSVGNFSSRGRSGLEHSTTHLTSVSPESREHTGKKLKCE